MLGVELAANVAKCAEEKGIPIKLDSARGWRSWWPRPRADLIVANNVLAHVPDINDFVNGIHCLLKPQGVATPDFPTRAFVAENRSTPSITSIFLLVCHRRRAHRPMHGFVSSMSSYRHGGSLRVYLCQTRFIKRARV